MGITGEGRGAGARGDAVSVLIHREHGDLQVVNQTAERDDASHHIER